MPDETGASPDVDTSLEPQRVVQSISQALSVCDNLEYEAEAIIKNQAQITAYINGQSPRNPANLRKKAKGNKTNISTGALAIECQRVPSRFSMPVFTARYLTSVELPSMIGDKPVINGPEKTEKFRKRITETYRGWHKWQYFIKGLAREVGIFGFGFPTFLNKYEWRPSLIRADKGFVPAGTELMEEPQFYEVKWNYKPHELIQMAKEAKDAEVDTWKIDAVVDAVNNAARPDAQDGKTNDRSFEELVRQASIAFSYEKGVKEVETKHLFAVEHTGKVSHWILWPDGKTDEDDPSNDTRLLYEALDEYDSMWEAVVPLTFDYGDGTIHGAWGAGQLLFDMAFQVELVYNDTIDALRNAGKVKIEVADPKDVNSVKLIYTDSHIITTAKFAGNTAALPSDISSFITLRNELSRTMQEKIGSYLPPIPTQNNDVKAAQVNAALAREQEIQQALLEGWLSQIAWLDYAMRRRLLNPESDDPISKATLKALREDDRLTDEEIEELRNQKPMKSITEFTPFMAMKVAQFAASKAGNPLYNQRSLEVAQTQIAAGDAYVDSFLLPDGDTSTINGARRQQQEEMPAMLLGFEVPVLPSDLHWYHMQEMKKPLEQAVQAAQFQLANIGLRHYAAHYDAGVETKTLPKEVINPEKSYIAQLSNIIKNAEQKLAQEQARLTGQPAPQGQQQGEPGRPPPVPGQPTPEQQAAAQPVTNQAPPTTQPNLPAPPAGPQAQGLVKTDPNL